MHVHSNISMNAQPIIIRHNKTEGVSDVMGGLEINPFSHNPVCPGESVPITSFSNKYCAMRHPSVKYFRPPARLSPVESHYPQHPHQMTYGLGPWMHNCLAPHQVGPPKPTAAVLSGL